MYRLLILALLGFGWCLMMTPKRFCGPDFTNRLPGTAAAAGDSGGNSVCARWCAANFPHPGADCTSLAAHGEGPCYVCGPLKTSQTEMLCGGRCSETSSDGQNCGGCGKVVSDRHSSPLWRLNYLLNRQTGLVPLRQYLSVRDLHMHRQWQATLQWPIWPTLRT
jgi:hypothetical protein